MTLHPDGHMHPTICLACCSRHGVINTWLLKGEREIFYKYQINWKQRTGVYWNHIRQISPEIRCSTLRRGCNPYFCNPKREAQKYSNGEALTSLSSHYLMCTSSPWQAEIWLCLGLSLALPLLLMWLSQLTFCLSTFPSVCTWHSSMCLTTHLDLALLDPKAWLKPVTQQQPALPPQRL